MEPVKHTGEILPARQDELQKLDKTSEVVRAVLQKSEKTFLPDVVKQKPVEVESVACKIERIKNAAARNGGAVSQSIHNEHIADQDILIEIAKIAAENAGRDVSRYIQNYGITDPRALTEIAKIAAIQSGRGVCQYLDNYGIENMDFIVEILEVAILRFGMDAMESVYLNQKSIWAQLQMEDRSRLIVSAFAFSCFEKELSELGKLGPMLLEESIDISEIRDPLDIGRFFLQVIDTKRDVLHIDANSYKVVQKILSYKGRKISGFLLGVFLRHIQSEKYREYFALLSDNKVQRLLPSIIPAKWMFSADSASVDRLLNFFTDFYRILKDKTKPLIADLLSCLCSIELLRRVPDEVKLQAIQNICDSSKNVQEIEKNLRLALCFAIAQKGSAFVKLQQLPSSSISQYLQDLFREDLLTLLQGNTNLLEKYEEMFLDHTRIPYALEIYRSNLFKEEPAVQEALHRFIENVLTDTLDQERFNTEKNSHLEDISKTHPDILQKWQELCLGKIDLGEGPAILTVHWEDMLLSGTEVKKSCQRIDAAPKDSKCLLAYLLDGKNAMIAIKDARGKIEARAMLRLFWDPVQGKPALFLDTFYPDDASENQKSAMRSLAQKCAAYIGCAIFEESTEEDATVLVSKGSCVPYEYSDASIPKGVQKGGIFSVRAKPL